MGVQSLPVLATVSKLCFYSLKTLTPNVRVCSTSTTHSLTLWTPTECLTT